MSETVRTADVACKWPACDCYSPIGPQECRRYKAYINSEPGKAWNDAYAASRPRPLQETEK
jgi:hypothetical protein